MAKNPVARFMDGLSNVLSGMGTGRDKTIANRWARFTAFSPEQIDAAYRSNGFVRKAHDIIPEEMVKNWRRWELPAAKSELIEDEEKRLKVRAVILTAMRRARLLGGAGVVMGLPGDSAEPAPEKIAKGQLKYLIPFTRYQLTFSEFSNDLEDPFFGRPKFFELASTSRQAQIHPSRVIIFPGQPSTGLMVRNQLDEFWGHPLLESANDALMDAATAPRAMSTLLHDARQTIIGIPGLSDLLSTAEGEQLLSKRLQVVELMKGLFGSVLIDSGSGSEGDGDTWEERQIRWAGLPQVGMFLLQVAAGQVDIPLTRFAGTSATGLNATGEGDEENFLKMIRSKQKMELRPALEQLDPYLIGSAGASDPKAVWTFNPLEEMTPEQQADHDNVVADTLVIVKESGLVQFDALAEVAVAVLSESPNFPGLADAVAKSTDEVPAVTEAQQAADAADAAAQAALQPPAVTSLVPNKVNPRAGAGGAARRVNVAAKDAAIDLVTEATTLADLRDGAPRTLYVSRKVLNPQEVLNHFRGQGLDNLEAAGDLHVTVMYSTTPVNWMKMPADWSSEQSGRLKIPPGGPRELEMFGPENDTLVQAFQAGALEWRHEALIEAGCATSWPCAPHITLAKEMPQDFDLSTLKPYTGRIVLGPEIWEEVRVKTYGDDDD